MWLTGYERTKIYSIQAKDMYLSIKRLVLYEEGVFSIERPRTKWSLQKSN